MLKLLQSIDDRLDAAILLRPWFGFLSLMALFIAVRAAQIYTRPVWFDEFSTYYVSRTFAFAELPYIITHSGDSQPPLYHLLNMPFLWVLGDRPESIRSMSLAAAVIGLAALFIWLKRTVSPGAALAAIAFLCASSLAFYSTEARPYSIWFCFLSLGLAATSLPFRIAFLAASASVHFLGTSTAVPLALTEKSWSRRFFYLLTAVPASISLWLAPSVEDMRSKALTAFDPSLIPHAFTALAGPMLFSMVLAVALVRWQAYRSGQIALAATLLAGGSLGVLLLFTRMAAPYQARYSFPLLIALALFLAWCVANSRYPGILTASVLLASMILIPVRAEKTAALNEVPLMNWLTPQFSRYPYLFVSDSYFFTGLSWHMKDPERSRFHFAYDLPNPLIQRDPRINSLAPWVALEQGEGRIDSLRQLMARQQPFVLLTRADTQSWLRRSLNKLPLKLTPLGAFEFHDLLLVELQPPASDQVQTESSSAAQ